MGISAPLGSANLPSRVYGLIDQQDGQQTQGSILNTRGLHPGNFTVNPFRTIALSQQ